eukprot:6054835-Pyramimonas_sp.AAC.1
MLLLLLSLLLLLPPPPLPVLPDQPRVGILRSAVKVVYRPLDHLGTGLMDAVGGPLALPRRWERGRSTATT